MQNGVSHVTTPKRVCDPKASRSPPHAAPSHGGKLGGAGPEKRDKLLNPLRAVFLRFACAPCGRFDANGAFGHDDNVFKCRQCLRDSESEEAPRFAYASLLYGKSPRYVLGALALGQSLEDSRTPYDRVLLHTADVSVESRQLLSMFWILVEVTYVQSAADLHPSSDKARFRDVFTKFHIFNPDALQYDRVVFLDLDTLVLKNSDALFGVRAPAAMRNVKNQGREHAFSRHGERMKAETSFVNAGTMVVAPSRMLFDLIVADVAEPDPEWHFPSWSPEQAYLSRILAGEWSQVSQLYNLEVQLHSGVPLTSTWEQALAEDVVVAHFSGSPKVWDAPPDRVVPVVANDWVRQTFDALPASTQVLATSRCNTCHAAWHRSLAAALRHCREQGFDEEDVGSAWAVALCSGEYPSTDAHTGVRAAAGALKSSRSLRVGDEAIFDVGDGEMHLAQVLCVRPSLGEAVVWLTPSPAQEDICAGPFGVCRSVRMEFLREFNASLTADDVCGVGLGAKAACWLGEGHARGLVVGVRPGERLMRFVACRSPEWLPDDELRPATPTESEVDPFQCVACLKWRRGGSFCNSDGLWYCDQCDISDMPVVTSGDV
eukprot:TRINITY_DN49754_c0_g1_i1.p1 TRINITY_DN49754_c0_g1~~TRINITY_DN49754_c0_g1_i1.p1  ORF type:complete len:625 (-),score=80.82 TRINITY_DN49754_c0_g1_i1:95-1900(-)